MKIVIDEPETQVVMRLRPAGPPGSSAVKLSARVAGSDDEQDILLIEAAGEPAHGDPLGQRNEKLTIYTLKVRNDFPAKLDSYSHVEIGMKM
jgi:hypothetical protein